MTRAHQGRPAGLRLRARERGRAVLGLSSFRLDPEEALALVGTGALLVDIRRHEDPGGFLEGAERIPPDEIPALVSSLPRDTPIVLACT